MRPPNERSPKAEPRGPVGRSTVEPGLDVWTGATRPRDPAHQANVTRVALRVVGGMLLVGGVVLNVSPVHGESGGDPIPYVMPMLLLIGLVALSVSTAKSDVLVGVVVGDLVVFATGFVLLAGVLASESILWPVIVASPSLIPASIGGSIAGRRPGATIGTQVRGAFLAGAVAVLPLAFLFAMVLSSLPPADF